MIGPSILVGRRPCGLASVVPKALEEFVARGPAAGRYGAVWVGMYRQPLICTYGPQGVPMALVMYPGPWNAPMFINPLEISETC